MDNKKIKLTISGSPKKSFKNFEPSKTQGKKTVIIEKKTTKSGFNKPSGPRPTSNFKKNFPIKTNPSNKSFSTSDFERRKLAEQRATKKIKNENDNDKKNKLESKNRYQKKRIKINCIKSIE